MELRWEGVPSLADALRMLRHQAERTPAPQWVRVVGGWSEFQFAERRMPPLDETNAAAPDTPAFILHLYPRALLHRLTLTAPGITRAPPNPPAAAIEKAALRTPTATPIAQPRMPRLDEINAAAPDTPVFILHLYARALLNRAALTARGITRDTPNPPGGVIEKDARGNPTGMLIAKPSALILYSTLAQGPKLPLEDQINSTRHFTRELNHLGITSVIDAGGGGQNYPEDYQVIQRLHDADEGTANQGVLEDDEPDEAIEIGRAHA